MNRRTEVTQPDTIEEFISQKRQMFRVELSKETLQKEIDKLDNQTSKRQLALIGSAQELEADKRDLHLFVEKSNKDRIEKEQLEKQLIKDKKEKEDKIYALNSEIQQLNSEIDKNKDMLQTYNELKLFMLELSDQDFLKEQQQKKAQLI